MAYYNPGCLGNYDFDNIALYARKRFIEGYKTIDLLLQAKNNREKEEIALVATMDLDDATVENLNLSCQHAEQCQIRNCRSLIKKMIEQEL
ncbi:MAG: hypothetical protein OEY11_10405 [Gammaproteobacteria bacterium]|nr:hypothetical protein [Gammaproteobacteria bacterium]